MAQCKKCASRQPVTVAGFEDTPYVEIASAVVSAYASDYVSNMLTHDADGVEKEGFLTDNPMVKNALFIAGGIGLSAFMKGEMYKGAGIGMATYGGFQLIQELMKEEPATTQGVNGLRWQPPTNIAGMSGGGMRTLQGNYGVAPNIVAGYGGSNYAEEDFYEKQEVAGLVRAL